MLNSRRQGGDTKDRINVVDPLTHKFVSLEKAVHLPEDMDKWLKSEAYHEYISFIDYLNEGVRGLSQSHTIEKSPSLSALVSVLSTFSTWVDEIENDLTGARFGNKAFRTWYDKISSQGLDILLNTFPSSLSPSFAETWGYLMESFGNSTRIDYGTGHEMSFIIFLYTLFRIGALDVGNNDDRVGAVTCGLKSYLDLVRKLQSKYRMEPAGSQGVWSLDDFQFVPFIFGSSQLIGNPKIEPRCFTDPDVIRGGKDEYMFLDALNNILTLKTGPFHEHSNQLWNISGASSWTKINQGLIKMYKGELLNKFPLIQHTYFGSLFSFKEFVKPPPTLSL